MSLNKSWLFSFEFLSHISLENVLKRTALNETGRFFRSGVRLEKVLRPSAERGVDSWSGDDPYHLGQYSAAIFHAIYALRNAAAICALSTAWSALSAFGS
ncbi:MULTISPECIES: hypothetical protein [Comamonas]|uniref:hypothetical protein n=1 Tax=Comamonas TaxID=283 RepID=UPI0012C54246|nr:MULTISPECIES: hypothetical protein [Comamonas]MPT12172.1 hypothetical protein [Comamonas sp.]